MTSPCVQPIDITEMTAMILVHHYDTAPRRQMYNVVSDSLSGDSLRLSLLKGECCVFQKIIILWMKTIHYPNTIRSQLVTIVPMAPFTPKSPSKLRSALHIRYSVVIPRFISRAITAKS